MNKDYAYCVGPTYFGGPTLCQNCKRHIPFCTEVKETLTWTLPMYDEKTGTCPLHEPKTENSNERNSNIRNSSNIETSWV